MSDILNPVKAGPVKKHISGFDMHDEIAKTYFHVPQKNGAKKNRKWVQLLPWVITAAAVAAAAVLVLSKSSIDIKVRFLGQIPALNEEGVDKGEFLIKGAAARLGAVKDAYFAGDGKAFSGARQGELVLCNSRGAGWANYNIELKEPADLNKLDIKYTAKGARGDEYLLLVIADGDNHVYRTEKDLSSSLTKDWKTYTINFRPVKEMFPEPGPVLCTKKPAWSDEGTTISNWF